MRKSISLGIIVAGLLFLYGCSSLPASLGGTATNTTAANPTGSATSSDVVVGAITAPVFHLPQYTDVASNCTKGDQNSCDSVHQTLALCKNVNTNQASYPAIMFGECANKGWIQALNAGAI